MTFNKILEDNDLSKHIQPILEKFEFNLMKAMIISKLRKEHIEASFLDTLKEYIEHIQEAHGVENIPKSQTIVMLVTSFEAFVKDFFKVMLSDLDKLKQALRQCKELRLKPAKIIDLLNQKNSWGDLILEEERLSFQRLSSFEKGFRMLGFEFEDMLEETKNRVDEFLSQYINKTTYLQLGGKELFEQLLTMRHRIVHESISFSILDLDLNSFFIFIQMLVLTICGKFFRMEKTQIIYDKVEIDKTS